MNRIKRIFFFVFTAFLFFWTSGKAISQSAFAKGEELFMQNKPAEALGFLETAANEDPAHIQAFLYLGIVYQQMDRLDDAITAYRRILPKGGKETARIAYNLGNAYFTKGNAEFARQYYTQALDSDPSWAPAFLNRANAQIKTGALKEAVADYEQYLELVPYSEKRTRIEALIAFIRDEFAEQERRRIQAEEAARAEAERRKRLIEEVSASLQAAAEDSKGLSAGIEDIQGYEGVFELE
ncbi:MAG: tetratricopeptide repeat protein [Treponema sp.]|jgi:tetratricopeptide (TPR) repeat protein|nr:tetratricopeptide repeat protein [Treponema sp.]